MSNDRDTIGACIKALEMVFEEHLKSNEAQGLLLAIEVLEELRNQPPFGASD